LRFSVIVPFHGDFSQLQRCLRALESRPGDGEVIVVGDGVPRTTGDLVARQGVRFLEQTPRRGPAAARNLGAAAAQADLLIFVDSDVLVSQTAISQIVDLLDRNPGIAAVFGAYDETPADTSFMSQYRNLAHSFVHQQGSRDAQTFWAGLGAVRRSAFDHIGGFDERFTSASVEDIDLGYRLRAAGHRIRLDPRIQGCHLKRWTLGSSIRIDIWCRGVPWTQLLLRSARMDNDLNLRAEYRLSVVCAYLLVIALGLGAIWPSAFVAAGALMIGLTALNFRYYAYFARRRGAWFALRVFPCHVLHHLCNGVSFVWGFALFSMHRLGAVGLPGAVPAVPWSRNDQLARTL